MPPVFKIVGKRPFPCGWYFQVTEVYPFAKLKDTRTAKDMLILFAYVLQGIKNKYLWWISLNNAGLKCFFDGWQFLPAFANVLRSLVNLHYIVFNDSRSFFRPEDLLSFKKWYQVTRYFKSNYLLFLLSWFPIFFFILFLAFSFPPIICHCYHKVIIIV